MHQRNTDVSIYQINGKSSFIVCITGDEYWVYFKKSHFCYPIFFTRININPLSGIAGTSFACCMMGNEYRVSENNFHDLPSFCSKLNHFDSQPKSVPSGFRVWIRVNLWLFLQSLIFECVTFGKSIRFIQHFLSVLISLR